MVLHVSPHPDDELIGAPAALMALRDAGEQVAVLALGHGRPEQQARREAELREGCRRAGFAVHAGADLPEAVAQARVVVSPHPGDAHPAHERAARAVQQALEALGPDGPAWWQWGLWRELPAPNLIVPFGEERMLEILHALDAHAGELARNDYGRLVRGRATAAAVLGPERVLGWGSPGLDAPYAELLCALRWREGALRAGSARILRGPALGHDV